MPVAEQDVIHVGLGSITKTSKQDDGSVLFEASKATGPELDSDLQIIDLDYARKAMESWFTEAANLREMHQPIAAGKALTLEQRDDGVYISGRVTDPNTAKKVLDGTLSALSVGIAHPRIIKDAKAPNGRVVGGVVVETSLVDRGANGACKLILAKADAEGKALFVEEMIDAPETLNKLDTVEPSVVANPDDPDAADPEALAKAKKGGGKKAPPFTSDKPKADDSGDDSDESDDEEDDGKKPATKAAGGLVINVNGTSVAIDSEDLYNAIAPHLAKAQAPVDEPTAVEVDPAEPVEKAAEPDLAKSVDDEMADIARAKRILADLAVLVQSEAAGFLDGVPGEICDLQDLVSVMGTLKWFIQRETEEAAAMADTTADSGTPTPSVIQLASQPDLEKAADKVAKKLRKRLEKAAAAATKTADFPGAPQGQYADDTTETTAEPDVAKAASTTDTETLTKAITDRVTADLAGQFANAITKAMEPLAEGLAEVKQTLNSTPRPGGPQVTRVQPQVPSEQLAKAAQIAELRKAYIGMLPSATPQERAAINAHLAELDKPAA